MTEAAEVLVAGVVAVAVLVVPGAALTSLLRLRGLPRAALVGPSSLAFLATLGIAFQPLGIHFDPVSAGIATLGLVLAAVLVHYLRERSLRPPRPRPEWLLIVIGTVTGCIAAATVLFAIDPVSLVNQSYDGIFHTNAAISIVATGDASAFDLYRISNPGVDENFYPAAWHVLVALTAELTDGGVPVAMLGGWIALTGVIWVPGMLWLSELWPSNGAVGWTRRTATVLLSATAVLMPGLLLAWGTLFPTALAYAIMPAGLALATTMIDAPRSIPRWVAPALVWFVAATLAHPRSLFSAAVILLPLLAWRVVGALRALARRSPRRAALWSGGIVGGIMIVTAGAGVVLYRMLGVADRPISDRLNGGPALATQGPLESLWQAVSLSAPVLPDGSATFPQLAAAALTLLGLGLLLIRRRDGWLVVAWLLLVLLYVLAAGSNSDIAKIATAAWYKDKYRLLALVPLVGIPLASAATAWIVSRVRASLKIGAAVLVGIAVTVGIAPSIAPQLQGAVAHLYRLGPNGTGLLDDDDLRLLSRLPDLVPEGQRIAGNPWNGAVASWAVGKREPLFPHFTGVWDADRLAVALYLDTAASDPAVCAALDRLDAHYLYSSPSKLWGGGDPQEVGYAAMDRAAGAPGFTEVAREGEAVLYRIDACHA